MMDSNTAANDFEYARQVYHDLLAKGSESTKSRLAGEPVFKPFNH